MTERPILFSPLMVKAIIAGTKTQTRRVAREFHPRDRNYGDVEESDKYPGEWFQWKNGEQLPTIVCPYGTEQDRLWVKEAWHLPKVHDDKTPDELWKHLAEKRQGVTVLYGALGWRSVAPFPRTEQHYPDDMPLPEWTGRLRSSMFMPKWASRLQLRIVQIRCEPLQSITEADALAEGMPPYVSGEDWVTPQERYAKFWDHLNASRDDKFAWSQNPWVWAINFERLEYAALA